jgi:hypothetical protein
MTIRIEPGLVKSAATTALQSACDAGISRVERASACAVRHLTLLLDPSRMRRIHHELAARLERDMGVRVTVARGRTQPAPPASIDLLLDLERLIYRLRGPRLSDRLALDPRMLAEPSPGDPPDLVVDLCGNAPAHGKVRAFRLLYDGVAGESVLIGALVAGRMPTIEIEDARTGEVIARGVACADNARTISDALECVLGRVITLIVSAARGWTMLARERRSVPPAITLRAIVALELKQLAASVVRRLYRLCFYNPHWRTCWRFVDGPDLWETRSLSGTSWNVIPDPGFRFYADPFPLVHEGKTYVFVEDFDHRTAKGIISVLPFDEHGPIGLPRPVLEEPWHLSYPFVFAHAGQVWMIPESSADKSIALYRADPFPYRWIREETLVSGMEASDATVIRHGDYFWMFAATRDGAVSWSDALSIFFARDLRGPWKAYPLNPVLVDQAAARPAGAMFMRGGKLWRPVQDCTSGYGTGIGLAEVVHLDHEKFEQRIHAVIHADPHWPGRRFHTLNRAGRVECIDGSAYSPRSKWVARSLEEWSGRRDPPPHWSRAP